MMCRSLQIYFWGSCVICLVHVSLGYVPTDSYLINCGSSTNISIGGRLFSGENSYSNLLSTDQKVFAATNSSPNATYYNSTLFMTATILEKPSNYTFPITEAGRHLIRLYFFPFDYGRFNLRAAKFSVSAQDVTLLKDFPFENGTLVREYSFNVTSSRLVLSFIPSSNSYAFINALEVTSLPNELTPNSTRIVQSPEKDYSLQNHAMESVARVSMGNKTVYPQDDALWRVWESDDTFLKHSNVKFVSNIAAVKYNDAKVTENIAPASVYGTATQLDTERDPNLNANLTWLFNVDSGFDYLVRFHLCDIVNSTYGSFYLNVYINSWYAYKDLDLGRLTSDIIGAPYYFDVVFQSISGRGLNVSVSPTAEKSQYPMAILNGLEIMKISNRDGSFVGSNSPETGSDSTGTKSQRKVIVIAGLASGIFVLVISISVLYLICKRRKSLSSISHDQEAGNSDMNQKEYKAVPDMSTGYCFPLAEIEEATNKFSEDLLIGFGGFGKVYRGVLKDGTKVAVKRGSSRSQQGQTEFRTEIEMLSQFRHRHLVSLIGYCDERNEMIIIYEYMENGTLKNRLYGSDLPVLSWKQRLEISIGAARGLHYLHTGSVKAIIHRDVKSANILLDENLMAKVADFGISKTGPDLDQTHVSTAVKGSFGYLDPEYLTRQQLTEKSDVYSFGVVMLEILCGRPVIDPSLPKEKVNLVEWAMKLQGKGKLEEAIDLRIASEANVESVRKYVEIAEKCFAGCGAIRPSMGDVLWNLEYALQLQGKDGNSSYDEGTSSEIEHVSQLEKLPSTAGFTMGGLSDLEGVSMSKVFAKMVKEEMR